MPPEILARVLEPFFTTKPIGKGTGLGLSMVHGFAKQSGGHMTIYSEVGRGSTFRLYFPRVQRSEVAKDPIGLPDDERVGGRETILVVEDEAAVRESATALLRKLGYAVLEAGNGQEAIAIADGGAAIDLLFTDMIMPGGMTGKALALQLGRRHPGMRILYCSGYTDSAIAHQGRLDEGAALLQKPYRRRDLARKVRKVLDEPAP
jgi:CheY-like chemotaxis protein